MVSLFVAIAVSYILPKEYSILWVLGIIVVSSETYETISARAAVPRDARYFHGDLALPLSLEET
jgi:hypothetical protein